MKVDQLNIRQSPINCPPPFPLPKFPTHEDNLPVSWGEKSQDIYWDKAYSYHTNCFIDSGLVLRQPNKMCQAVYGLY